MGKFLVAGALCMALALPAAADEPASSVTSFLQVLWESVLSLLPEDIQTAGGSAIGGGEVPAEEMLPSFPPNG